MELVDGRAGLLNAGDGQPGGRQDCVVNDLGPRLELPPSGTAGPAGVLGLCAPEAEATGSASSRVPGSRWLAARSVVMEPSAKLVINPYYHGF